MSTRGSPTRGSLEALRGHLSELGRRRTASRIGCALDAAARSLQAEAEGLMRSSLEITQAMERLEHEFSSVSESALMVGDRLVVLEEERVGAHEAREILRMYDDLSRAHRDGDDNGDDNGDDHCDDNGRDNSSGVSGANRVEVSSPQRSVSGVELMGVASGVA